MAGKFALLIGNDRYEDNYFDALTRPRADVESLKAVLEKPNVSGFDRVDILLNGSLETVMSAIGCPARPSGNMPPVQVPKPLTAGAMRQAGTRQIAMVAAAGMGQ